MIFNTKLDKAIKFATMAHKGQMRKTDSDLPYSYHIMSVGFLLLKAGFSDDVVIAGILHDVIEDCGVTKEEITNLFGENVAYIVSSVSEDKTIEWERRKQEYMNNVMNGSDDVKAVFAADKIHNIHNLLDLLERGEDLSKYFKKDTKTTILQYINYVDSLESVWSHELVGELKLAIENLKRYL